jgi:hypothetical protein
MKQRCTCITLAVGRTIYVRDPWCKRHGELPVQADEHGVYRLPAWTVGMVIDGSLIIAPLP